MADLVTPFLNGAIGVGQSLFNHNLAEKSAEKQHQRQLDFWNKQNAYNSPAAQRQRFQEAGMNPASATGQMATSGTAQGLSSVPGNEYAQQGALKLDGLASTLETIARIEKLGAETGLATAQMTTEGMRQFLIGMGFEEKRVDILLKDYEAQAKHTELQNLPEFFRHRNAIYDLDEKFKSAQIDYQNALKSLTDAQTEESKASAKKLVAESGLIALKQETEKELAQLTLYQRFESKSRTELNRQEFRFNQLTENLRVKSLRIANEIGASDAQLEELEVAYQDMRNSLYIDENGDATLWAKTAEFLDKAGSVLGIAVGSALATGLGKLGKSKNTRDPDINPDYSMWR